MTRAARVVALIAIPTVVLVGSVVFLGAPVFLAAAVSFLALTVTMWGLRVGFQS